MLSPHPRRREESDEMSWDHVDLTALVVPTEPVAIERSVSNDPRDGALEVTTFGDLEIGVWEMTPGTATDVEGDEVFVVLSGRAIVAFDNGSTIALKPGSLCRLREGQRTTWQVTETLRKLYVVRAELASGT